jgi:hypothetical protein
MMMTGEQKMLPGPHAHERSTPLRMRQQAFDRHDHRRMFLCAEHPEYDVFMANLGREDE